MMPAILALGLAAGMALTTAFCVWPFDLKQMGTSFPDVIDYFAMGVLVLIALLAVARLFPPPDRAQ